MSPSEEVADEVSQDNIASKLPRCKESPDSRALGVSYFRLCSDSYPVSRSPV